MAISLGVNGVVRVSWIGDSKVSRIRTDTDSFSLQRLEASCSRDPDRFGLVTGLVAISLVTIFICVFFVALAVSVRHIVNLALGADITTRVTIELLVGGYFVLTGLRALRPTQQKVSALELMPLELPKLFQLLDKVSQKTGLRLPETVLLSGELQTRVVTSARLGFVGGHRHRLIISYPALATLDVKQFAAIVGRELHRIGSRRRVLSSWVQSMRITWSQMAEVIFSETSGRQALAITGLGAAGCLLYLAYPWFNTRALVMARHQSFTADHLAGCLTGSQSAMDAIVRLEVQNSYLEQLFWPSIFSRAGQSPKPDVSPFRVIVDGLRSLKLNPKAPQWLAMSLQAFRSPDDTESCLRERLSRSKSQARLTPPPQQSAAESLLRDSLASIVERLDAAWTEGIRDRWSSLHQEYLAQQRLEKELQAESDKGPMHADDQLLWAHSARRVYGDDTYQALLRLMLIDHPGEPHARYELGCLLLEQDSTGAIAEGSDLLRKLAFEQTNSRSLAAAERYSQWLLLQSKPDEAAFWSDEVRRLTHLAQEAKVACNDFNQVQRFTAPDLSARQIDRIRRALSTQRGLEKAHLVSKLVGEFRGWRFLVLLVHSNGSSKHVARNLSAVMEALKLPASLTVIDASDPVWLTTPRKSIAAQIMATTGAVVFKLNERNAHKDGASSSILSVLPGTSPT